MHGCIRCVSLQVRGTAGPNVVKLTVGKQASSDENGDIATIRPTKACFQRWSGPKELRYFLAQFGGSYGAPEVGKELVEPLDLPVIPLIIEVHSNIPWHQFHDVLPL